MKLHDYRGTAAVALVLCSVASGFVACSSSSDPGAGAGADGGGVTPAACTNNAALTVAFSPMYSANDGVHTFQIPAIVDGVAASAVTWSASDPSIVDIAKDDSTGGIMITTRKAGSVTITAEAGGLCGTSLLTVSQASSDDWTVGSERYNNGVVLRFGQRDAGADAAPPNQAACTNCHGATANGAFTDIAHTPEQTGGFSDEQLIAVFTHGVVPDGGYFDTAIIPYALWQRIHQWDMTPEQAKAVVVYLRSLTPEAQAGSANFGGRGDGGARPPRDGGGPGRDAATGDGGP